MIFTPQCLVSMYNLAKIDPINIKSKQLYSPHFGIRCIVWWRTQKNTKYSFWKQRRNKVRVDVLLTPCSPGRNRAKHRDSREVKTKTSFTGFGTNSSTDCSTFWMSPWKFLHSFSIGMAFLNDSSGLHWTNHVTLSPDCDNSEFTQQDGKKEKDGKMRVCDKRDRTITCMCCRNLH